MRVHKGASIECEGVQYFTDSSLTVAGGVVDKDSRWAQRPRHQPHQPNEPPLASMFAPPVTTRETFEERLKKSPMYINVGDEIHWPSTMSSEDGTELALGIDGSLLIKKQAAAATAEEEEAESDPVVQPVVTLIAADFRKSSRALEKRRMASGKDGSKVPGRAGSDAGRRTILKITDMGDVVSGPEVVQVIGSSSQTLRS